MTRTAEVSVVELKRCPRCEESLPLSEFGVCRARKDGLNLYCKRCIRQKIAQSRQALREYKNARIKHGADAVSGRPRLAIDTKSGFSPRRIARMLRKLSPADRVRGVGIGYQSVAENIYVEDFRDPHAPPRSCQLSVVSCQRNY